MDININDLFGASSIKNKEEKFKSRLTCIEVGAKGYKFRREHPMHNGETFFMSKEQFENSHWEPINEN
jgi:hypothetical protein